jgi:hypothetical protein
MFGQGRARIYNMISVIFLLLSVAVVIYVILQLFS